MSISFQLTAFRLGSKFTSYQAKATAGGVITSTSPRSYRALDQNRVGHGSQPKVFMAQDWYSGQDAYQVLEVPRNADKKSVKTGYR